LMINILFIVNSLKRRGAEQQLFSFFKSLPTSLSIHVFTFSNNSQEFPELFDYSNVSIHTNPYAGTYNLSRIRPLFECFKQEKIDAVVTVGLGAALVLGRLAAIMFNKKIIYSTLNTIENFNRLPKPKGAYFDILNLAINRILPLISNERVLRFLPNSDQLTHLVVPSLKRYPVRTLYNGIPLNELSAESEDPLPKAITTILSAIKARPCVIQVGALDANKNVMFTLECMRRVRESVSDACLLIVGDGPVKQDLEAWASANNMQDCVHFTGQLPRLGCLFIMKKASLITLTSLSESFPNVLLEGQALGLPAVTFDVGAAAEIVEHGETGYVTPINDQTAFTKGLVGLLKDHEKAKAMGKRAMERVRHKFSMDRKVETFMSMMKKDMRSLGY
jgi:glycosyltransferase involved in cell wall biosynthesis